MAVSCWCANTRMTRRYDRVICKYGLGVYSNCPTFALHQLRTPEVFSCVSFLSILRGIAEDSETPPNTLSLWDKKLEPPKETAPKPKCPNLLSETSYPSPHLRCRHTDILTLFGYPITLLIHPPGSFVPQPHTCLSYIMNLPQPFPKK